ncbi:RAMP superfamily CRISPR-associated protein [Desulfurobacterium crinifex]
MKQYRVLIRRKEGSPILYTSRTEGNLTLVEKEPMNIRDKIFEVPVIKGSHFRGRLRRFIGKAVFEKKAEKISKLKGREKQSAFTTAILLYFGGSALATDINDGYEVYQELLQIDPFYRYFGYMIPDIPNTRSALSVGFALPVIEGVTADKSLIEDFSLKAVSPDEVRIEPVEIAGTKFFITKPFIAIETSRKAGILSEAYSLAEEGFKEELKETEEVIASYAEKRDGKQKRDLENLLNYEVMAPAFDLIQVITFTDDDEEMQKGILTGYIKLFKQEPFIGGRAAAGYGLVEEITILDEEGNRIEPDEKALEHFIDSIDLSKVAELLALKKKEGKK